MKIQLNKNRFLEYLEAIQKINDIFIFDIIGDEGSVVTVNNDETCFLYATTKLPNSNNCTLNIPDCRKLSRVLKQLNEDIVELTHTSNALKYTSKAAKFTYHLYDSDFLKRPAINPDKVKSFQFDITLDLKKDVIKNIVKNGSFVDQANKIYFYTEDGNLYCEITDKQRANTDSFSMMIKENVGFTLDHIIFKLDNIQLLHLCSDDVLVKFHTSYKLLSFEFTNDDNKFTYILTSLKQ
jgi:hypothetical protein